MENQCAVPGCLSKKGHQFPPNPELRQTWIDVLGLQDPDPYSFKDSSFVCHRHFTSGDYDNVTKNENDDAVPPYHKLKQSAVPSTNLPIQSVLPSPKRPKIAVVVLPKPSVSVEIESGPAWADFTLAAPAGSRCESCKHRVVRSVQCYSCKGFYHKKCAENASAIRLGRGYVRCCDVPFQNNLDGTETTAGELIVSDVDPWSRTVAVNMAAGVREPDTKVKQESFSSTEESSMRSSPDEYCAIPPQEIVIKQEPDKSPVHSLENHNLPIKVEKPSGEENEQIEENFSFGVDPSVVNNNSSSHPFSAGNKSDDPLIVPKKNLKEKANLADFTEEDMNDPKHAAKFYLKAKTLWRENLLLCARNEKLAEEIKCLKMTRRVVTLCASCNGTLPKIPGGNTVVDGNANEDTLKRSEDEEVFEIAPTEELMIKQEFNDSDPMDFGGESEEDMEFASSNVAENGALSTSPSALPLPEKSKKKYEMAYRIFLDWQKDQRTTSFAENVLVPYFNDLVTARNFKATTLWSHYSMLRTILANNHAVDIAKYSKLRAFLKRRSDGYKPKQSRVLTASDINRFIRDAPDGEYLLMKVALVMGVMGACRRDELHRMKITDMHDSGANVSVSIPDSRTRVLRTFTITGHLYEKYKQYAGLRPKHVHDSWFFLNYHRGRCTTQRVGINKFGNMGVVIAEYLKLPSPTLYTGHCFRLSSKSILVDAEGNITCLKKHGGWISTAVAKGCNDPLRKPLEAVNATADSVDGLPPEAPSTSSRP